MSGGAFIAVKTLGLVFGIVVSAAGAAAQSGGASTADVVITVLADEIAVNSSLRTDLGFSCLVQVDGKSVLFDTGSDGPTLLANADTLHTDLSALGAVVVSHPHTDHTAGLSYLLTSRVSHIPVYVGRKYFAAFAGLITSWKCTPVAVTDTMPILPGIHSSGELPGSTFEQALVIDTQKGLVIITGCAHPGIINIIARIKERFRREVYLVLGGLHLLEASESEVQEVVRQFRILRVRKCAPTHCTGGAAVAIFRREYGPDFIPVGTGSVIRP